MHEVKIEILNWEKYHPRKDVSNPSWLRLQNKLWNDSQFFCFTAEEMWVWICLLSIASQKQTSSLKLNLDWLAMQSKVKVVTIQSCLEKLTRNECVTCAGVTQHNETIHNKTIHNETNIVCVEPKQVLVTTHTVNKKDPFLFINQKLLELYPQEYIDREKVKMEMWLATNGHKRPKSDRGMVRFVTSWLSRGWDQYRRGLQSNAPKEKTWQELLAEDERKLPDGH